MAAPPGIAVTTGAVPWNGSTTGSKISRWTKVLLTTSLNSENQALRSQNGPGDIFRDILSPNPLIPKKSS
jgi:hypothetical protein